MIRRFYRKWSLKRSFVVSTALMMTTLVLAMMVLVHFTVANALRIGLEERGGSVARSIGAVVTPALLAYNDVALQMAAESAAEDLDLAYVAIQTKEGKIAGFAGEDLDGSARSEFDEKAISGVESTTERLVRVAPDELIQVLEVAVPVWVDGVKEPWGTVRVGMSREPVIAQLWRLAGWLILAGLAFGAVATWLGRWVAGAITAPLQRLVDGTKALSAGRYQFRIRMTGTNELAQMADAFNVMMDRTQEKERETKRFREALESLNATLEDQVRERTRALQESEEQYKTLVDNSPDSILILQKNKIKFVNQAFVSTFGVQARVALQQDFDFRSLFEPESAQMVIRRVSAWEAGETPGSCDLVGRDVHGNIRHLELRGSGIEYLGEQAAECVLIDNTVAKSLREQLVDTERLRALGELSGGVAHDFNNLLSAILGRTQLLRRELLSDEVDRNLAVIEKAALDGRETVRRIQEFSRTRQEKDFSRLDLEEILRDAVEITRTRWKTDAERNNISVRLDLSLRDVCPVLGKDSELREVFTNLILNALDAMPAGGVLRVRCIRDGATVLVEVTDTGIGMDEDTRRHLFDPFFTTKGQGGTGLGLSMVYGIVTRHGGRIEVTSEPGRGTSFFLEFPVAQEQTPSHLPGSAEDKRDGEIRPSKILVIDDEPEIAEILKDVLTAEGHTVETASGGREGLQRFSEERFDLVFTDLGMPDMSGWDVASGIREDNPGIPVVLVTGWGATLNEEEVESHSIAAVVNKPFDITDLVEVTGTILGHGQSADPL